MKLYEHRGYSYQYAKSLTDDGMRWEIEHKIYLKDVYCGKILTEHVYCLGEEQFQAALEDWLSTNHFYQGLY